MPHGPDLARARMTLALERGRDRAVTDAVVEHREDASNDRSCRRPDLKDGSAADLGPKRAASL